MKDEIKKNQISLTSYFYHQTNFMEKRNMQREKACKL